MLVEEVQNLVNQVKTKEDLEFVTDQLRILASNVKNKKILKIIDLAITKSRNLNHENAIINLLELKIKQEFHLNENTEELSIFVEEMIELAVKRDYIEGLALAYTTKWGIEKLRGNEDISIITLIKAKKAVSELEWKDYTYYICTYSFAVHEWLVNRDLKIGGILEECSNYFFRKKFYRSFAHCLSILILFYQQTQNKEQPMITIKNILANYDFLSKIQEEIQSIIHFFIGFSQELSFNFNEAEKHLQES